jgi:hypothetical protein
MQQLIKAFLWFNDTAEAHYVSTSSALSTLLPNPPFERGLRACVEVKIR